MLAIATAVHLHGLGLVDFHRDGTEGGDCFLTPFPSTPDAAVRVHSTGGYPQLSTLPEDLPTIQIVTRGPRFDPRASYERARAIYSALTCLDGVTLDEGGPDEVHVITCTAATTDPIPLGEDDNQRPRWSLNFDFRTHHPTTHRPT
jgi:hypothetical protein